MNNLEEYEKRLETIQTFFFSTTSLFTEGLEAFQDALKEVSLEHLEKSS